MMLAVSVLTAAALVSLPRATVPQATRTIPTVYEAGHFYAVPETSTGAKLKLLVDTGGGGAHGMYWISAEAAERLSLHTRACQLGSFSLVVADVPAYKLKASLPAPLGSPCGNALMVQKGQGNSGDDGQLGAGYLPSRVWTFDYPAHKLLVMGQSWKPVPSAHAVTLGFMRNAMGELATGMPRITVRVDGKPVQMLLDTGASAHPTAAGKKASHTATVHDIGVTSYIDRTVFEQWHKAHPTWRVVESGDDLFGPGNVMPIIEVPEVEIAGWLVGPVWFTGRPDTSFRTGDHSMSTYMDQTIDGAVGANVFSHFVMTIDYPHNSAYFECATGCRPAKPDSL